MLTSLMLWNEPNNVSHWDRDHDQDWSIYARMVRLASQAIRAENPKLTLVLGGVAPPDPGFFRVPHIAALLSERVVDAVGVHLFPADWHLQQIEEIPETLAEIAAVTHGLPLWGTEVGIGSFASNRSQAHDLSLLLNVLDPPHPVGRLERIYLYSLLDLPRGWETTTRHQQSEGSAWYRHFYMGLCDSDGKPKPAFETVRWYARPMAKRLGVVQPFQFPEETAPGRYALAMKRLQATPYLLDELGVYHVRTGLSWADAYRPAGWLFLDATMRALDPLEVCGTLWYTPPSESLNGRIDGPPKEPARFADFAAEVARRYR